MGAARELAAAWARWEAGPGSRDRVVELQGPLQVVADECGISTSQLIDRVGAGRRSGKTLDQAISAARVG